VESLHEEVGAAMVDCRDGGLYGKIVVVFYLPPGNMEGQYAQNVGRRR
jgi:hypothetical protein